MTVRCPHCVEGTVTKRTGSLWWEREDTRCGYCGGTGLLADEYGWLQQTEESSCPACGAGEHELDRCAERSTP